MWTPSAPATAVVADDGHTTVASLFERQVVRDPAAPAIVAAGDTLTYGQVDRLASELADRLRAFGVRPGEIIGLDVERARDLPGHLLGVLKAGCAFAQIADLDDRRALQDVDVVVTVRGGRPPAIDRPSHSGQANESPRAPRRMAACALYAGDDAPIALSHAFVVAQCEAIAQRLQLRPGDRVSHVGALGGQWLEGLLPALLAGATVVDFAPAEIDLDTLCEHVETERIAALDVPLGTWRRLSGVRGRDGTTPLRVRCLVRGSVAATARQLERWSPRAFDRSGISYAYQPARWPIAIGFTSVPAAPAVAGEPRRFPAIDLAGPSRVSVRDPRMQPAFAGAVGELCIEADALVRTDLQARQRFDGRLQLLAPLDGPTVGGRRLNLDEVASALLQHPRVHDATVRAVPIAESGRTRLVAFCALTGEPATDGSSATASSLSYTLQAFLRERLPDYMAPPVSIAIEALPFSESGSVDEARLPAGEADVETSHEPAGDVEEQLAAIWRRLLNVARIGTRDNFFELGGHSLVAIALAAEVRSAFAVPLTLRELFDAPTIAQMAALIDARRGAGDGAAADETELVRVTPHPETADQPFPLTDVQQAYWVGRTGAFGLGNVATHAYYEVDATGLDLPRFEASWQRLIARHGMLRAIIQPDGQQRILPDVPPYQIAVTDLTGLAPEAKAAGLDAVRDRMSHQVLASDRWPLFEIHAARSSDTEIRLYFSLDALILDAWSMQILFRELSRFYHHPEETLPPLEVSYRDYVTTHRELESGAAFREAQAYWAQRRTTLPPAPDLPLAHDPASIDRPRFVRWSGRLDPDTWAQLKVRATRSRMTPSIVLLAAYAEVLAMWSKGPQFAINLTLFNRLPLHPQVNDLVGDFTSVTLLAVDGQPTASFAQRAHRVQEQFWEDLDHHLVSGIRVLRDMARARNDTSGLQMPVVFTSSLIHGEEHADETPMAWLGRVVYSVTQTPQVWLDHEVYEDGRALVFTWDVVANLFPDGVIQGMFDAFTTILQRLAASEEWWDAPWPDVHRQLLPAPQVDLVAQANATDAPIATTLLHTLFADQVRRRPDELAVVTSGRSLTYRELEQRASRIGRTLRLMGARPNACVAVVMAKGWEQVVAVLGILNAGAAYLPIDPALPRERVLFLLEHAQVSLVLTQRAVDESFSWPPHVRRFAVDGDDLSHVDAGPLEPVQAPEDLAYVIFTSGSTGVPKGVMIDHLGAVNTILDINRRYQVGPHDRVLALSSLSFDLSVWDIFGLLAAGGTIVIPDAGTTRDPAHWVSLVSRERVTIWNSVPALMQMLVEYSDATAAFTGSLRLVLMSGDWIPIALPDRIRALAPDVRLVSLGGATEASIWSILYDIDAVDRSWTSIPYGRPMANQTWHVLDAALEPRPVWTPGQLYIGGIGVAKGYLRDEARTKASFIAHPRTGETLYRTGDLGRWLPDGTIEFLGREDTQVKVQGHRIELGEIDAALAQHPSVRSVAVSAVGDRTGEKRLIAYVVPETARSTDDRDTTGASARAEVAGPIADPLAQLRFKLSEPGLRGDRQRQGVVLPPVNASSADLMSTYIERRSYRSFTGDPLRLDQLGELVSCLRQWRVPGAPLPKYRYGSAGSLYAVQLYAYVTPAAVDGLDGGVYYYDPRDHRLVPLASDVDGLRDIYAPNDRARFDRAGLGLFLVGDVGVIERLYPDDGVRFALLEAGLMTQLLEQTGPGFDIGLCQIGKIDFARVRHAFALGERHVLLNALVAGAIEPAQRTVAAFLDEAADLQPLVEAARATEVKDERPAAVGADLRSVWRTWLQGKVPGYMIPAEFVTMEALPLSSNGKVDRKALPAPREAAEAPRTGFVAARNDLERQLVEVLQGILGVERIGVHDSFFELGGNSVHLVQFHNRLEQLIGGKIPITAVFQHVTLSALSEYLVGMTPAAPTDRTEAVASGKQRLAQLLQRRKQ
jgi:amino acid adenylation domain-containing protein